jgi:isopenicillin N synthase-like dioxygenase
VKILDVDLLHFEKGDAQARRAAVDGVMRSLATGFVYLEHDVSSDLIDRCYARLEAFFALDVDAKARTRVPDSRGQRGYTGVLVETAAGAQYADWKETLNWGEAAPEGHPLGRNFADRYAEPVFPEADFPGMGEDLMRFHREILALQRRFLRIVAVGLGAHESFFDAMTEHGATLTRAAHYPPMDTAPGERHVWAAEHGDINLVTALPRATAPGLQVKTAEGWVDAAPPEDRAILNSGMMLEHFSNGVLPTGIHRVIAPIDSSSGPHSDSLSNPGTDPNAVREVGRIAVVQFCHPTPDTILAPLASCITRDHPQRFGSVSAATRLDEVLWEIKLADEPCDGDH